MTHETPPSKTHLRVDDVFKSFELGSTRVEVLRGASLSAEGSEALALTGPSGSGKSTLLHIIGTLEAPTAGRIEIGGLDPTTLDEPQLARFRNSTVGFVFQDSYLLPQYSVLENVLLPAFAFPARAENPTDWGRELLDRVGLGGRLDHRPAELSGGERQRAAVARALINRPQVLLCDEPTGSLDANTAETIADLLFQLHAQERNLLLVVTHSLALAERFPRRIELREGRCVEV